MDPRHSFVELLLQGAEICFSFRFPEDHTSFKHLQFFSFRKEAAPFQEMFY